MAVLCWMAVTLSLLLSAGNSLADVDQNQLAGIVQEVLKRYTPSYVSTKGTRRSPMFSLAVSIPYDSRSKMYDMNQVHDTGADVKNKTQNCDVYIGTRVVAATVLRWPNVLDQCPDEPVQWSFDWKRCERTGMTWDDVDKYCPKDTFPEGKADHAEYRTLQKFDTLVNNLNENDLLLFYILASPCDKRCTSETSHWSILNSINQILNWKNYAVVFTNVFKPRGSISIPEENLRGSLERLGKHQGSLGSIGLRNIFRCNGEGAVQCTSCSSGNQVASYCFSDKSKPGLSHNLPSTSFIQPQHGGRDSPSQSNTGGGQGGSGSGGGKGRRRSGRGKKTTNDGEGVPSSQSGLEVRNPDVDSNTGGGQGGSGPGVDSGRGGGKGRRRRGRGKKSQTTNEGEGVPSSQSGLEVRNPDVDSNTGGGQGGSGPGVDSGRGGGKGRQRGGVRKVGGRRVGKKTRGGGNKQKSKQAQGKKKTQTNKRKKKQSRGTTQWSQKVQGKAKQSEKRQKSNQPQRRGEMQRGGEMRRVNQPQRRGEKQKRGKKQKRG